MVLKLIRSFEDKVSEIVKFDFAFHFCDKDSPGAAVLEREIESIRVYSAVGSLHMYCRPSQACVCGTGIVGPQFDNSFREDAENS
jgi:hypothetical protein